jgi:hypothetical protein
MVVTHDGGLPFNARIGSRRLAEPKTDETEAL